MKNKFIKFLPAALFIAFTLSLGIAFFALPKKDFSDYEKRYLAETPIFSLSNLLSGDLVKEIDGDSENGTTGYVSDHFPFRSFFVGLNSYYNLGFGNTANSDYYFGEEGFIITKPYNVRRLDTNIKVLNSFSEDMNVTLGVVPSVGYILEDKLPQNHISYKDAEVYEKLKAELSENINYCDLEAVMKDFYSSGEAPYYKTDHHWTTSAAYEAYKALSSELSYIPTDESYFTKTEYEGFCGTTYSSSGYFLAEPDTLVLWEQGAVSSRVTVDIHEGESVKSYDSMFFLNHLDEPDMYPVFLDGNHSLVKIKNPDAEGGKLLVIKDSYAHALVPFLADNYSEIVMVDMRYYKESVSELCKAEGISDALILYSISNFCTDTGLAFLE
ncbi:MAG: DHHW family protein [Ruminococcus sp.]|nr:DHHW family protein [Ruminococcus sp.]